jgi:hypothetical protein
MGTFKHERNVWIPLLLRIRFDDLKSYREAKRVIKTNIVKRYGCSFGEHNYSYEFIKEKRKKPISGGKT